MRKRVVLVLLPLLVLAGLVLLCRRGSPEAKPAASPAAHSESEGAYWTCGMHPTVRVSQEAYEAGATKCPICKMDLIPVRKAGANAGGEVTDVTVALSPAEQRLASVRTFEASYLPLFHEIRAVGVIDYDERNVAHISSRVPGRIEKLYVSFTGERVTKGDPLVLIYSPALINAQQEYLLALATIERIKDSPVEESRASARSLVESSRNRLLLWGITEEQVASLEETGETSSHLTIYSPQSGTVIAKHILEGEYVKEGKMLYGIADLSNLWVIADIYQYEIPWLDNGQDVEITTSAHPGQVFKGAVSFIDPYLHGKTRSVKVRVDLPNPDGEFKPDMYVDVLVKRTLGAGTDVYYTCPMHPAVVSSRPGDCPECGMPLEKVSGNLTLAIPKSAVLDVGRRKLVYVDRGKGVYEQREVEVGSEAEAVVDGRNQTFHPLTSGVSEGESVVVNANFLIDSQTQLTGQAAGAYGGALETEGPSGHQH